MKLVCLWTALTFSAPQGSPEFTELGFRSVTVLQGATSPGQEARAPASVIGSKEERKAKAAANYEANRPVEAALGFEGLWRDFPQEPDFLFNAAASRHAAGHHAHAVAYSREYLAHTNISDEDRKEAEAQIRDALIHVFPARVDVVVIPGGSGEITVSAQHIARESGDVRPELLFPASISGDGTTVNIELDAGMWAIRAQGPGYRIAEQRIQVSKGGKHDVQLRLELAPQPISGVAQSAGEVPPRLVKPLILGFGIGGGITALTGGALLAVGTTRINKLADFNAYNSPEERVLGLVNGIRLRDAGAMTFGGGVGLLAGGLVWLAKDPRTRRIAWITEAAVGGGALIGGVAGLFLSLHSFNLENKTSQALDAETWSLHYRKHDESAGHAVSAMLIGLGTGMVASSATGLIIQRKMGASVQIQPAASPTHAGVAVSGRF